ncbi:hypothetical protein A7U60_g4460 [Sanghuangporus baumii]|uniref:Uncharacterized protein n=1 Tax=Sanghuangporus baumii TaxID=108892 RepID=A0A9Q5HYM4_SANBA|nr:hypothetical protein A7U60_g4460 [Sanghuangporus baumii]
MLSTRPISRLQDNADYSREAVTKTPGRALKGRAGLQENVLQNGSMTANPREKRVGLQTPFHQGPSKIILQDAQNSSKLATLSGARPLGDKTPKPNRQSLSLFTPGPRNQKASKLVLPPIQGENDVPSPTQPPSSSRTKLRNPRPSKCFETPVTKGDHWNVSDVSIHEGTSTLGKVNEAAADELDDDSEPEYMPPKPIEPPYEPPFEVPDYREVGQTLLELARSYPVDDSPYVYQVDSEDLLKGCDWPTEQMHLDLPASDEDEIFGPRISGRQANTRTATSFATTGKQTVSRPPPLKGTAVARKVNTSTYSSRPATSLAIRAPDPKPAVFVSRPGTSASNSRPSVSRGNSKYQIRVAPNTKGMADKSDKNNILAFQISDGLEQEDDFRFCI